MFRDRYDVAGASIDEEVHPRFGIKMLSTKEWNEVLVAEVFERTVGGDLMPVGRITGNVHVARVPFVSECRNGIHAPMEEDAKLGVAKPIGCAVGSERFPRGVERDAAIRFCRFYADLFDLLSDSSRIVGLQGCLRAER